MIADLLILDSQVPEIQNFTNEYMLGNQMIIGLTGTPSAPSSCALQRMFNNMVVNSNLTSTSKSFFGISSLSIGNISNVAQLSLVYTSNTTLYGTIPNIDLVVIGEVSLKIFFVLVFFKK